MLFDPAGNGTYDANLLKSDLTNGRPAILQNAARTHWFLAKGTTSSSFLINDPFYSRSRLDDPAYGNTASTMRRFMKTASDFSAIEIAVPAPAQILVTSPDGFKTGYDPALGSEVEGIVDSVYLFDRAIADDTGANAPSAVDAGVRWVIIKVPQAGTYSVEVIAPAGTEYSFAVYGSDRDASTSFRLVGGRSSSTPNGDPPQYAVHYDPAPGGVNVALGVTVDIMPGSSTNPINLKSNGVVPLAILSTETFDASEIVPSSVRFGPSSASEVHGRGHIEDVNRDGRLDLVLHFTVSAVGLQSNDRTGCVSGRTTNGFAVKGCDALTIIGR